MKKCFLFKRGKYYHLEYFDESKNRVKRISTGETKRTLANKFLMSFKEQQEKTQQIKFITLSEFERIYIDHVKKNFSKSYLMTIEVSFRLLKKSLGNPSLNKITLKELEDFITETFQRTKEGARTYFIALRSAFNKAIRWSYLGINHFNKIQLPKIPQKENTFITPDQFKKILSVEKNKTLRDIYHFAYYTGARLSEIINCKLSWIDLASNEITIKNDFNFNTKSKKNRTIPISGNIKSLLIKYKTYKTNNEDYLFTKNGVKFNKDYISKSFKKAVRKIFGNKTEIEFHDLRKSFGSQLIQNNVNLMHVKELLGHSDVKVTQRNYLSILKEDLQHAIEQLTPFETDTTDKFLRWHQINPTISTN